MLFITLLVIITLCIAGSAGFFSIYGLAKIFSGTFWPVVIMGSSLEAGKLIAASYLYRFWNHISIWIKSYLILAILSLMLITSMGIFGFLSAAYQEDIVSYDSMTVKVDQLKQKKEHLIKLKEQRLTRKQQIDADITSLPNNFITGRQRLMKSYKPELETLKKDIAQYTNEIQVIITNIHDLQQTVIQKKVHVGPIVFIAKALGISIDDATKWMIFLIIFVFDPLAVILTIGINVAIDANKSIKAKEEVIEIIKEPEQQITLAPNEDMSMEQIHKVLEEYQSRELTPMEQAQKILLERLLRKSELTQRVRSHHKTV